MLLLLLLPFPLLDGLECLEVLPGRKQPLRDEHPASLVPSVKVPQVLEVGVEIGEVDEDADDQSCDGDEEESRPLLGDPLQQ